MSANAGNRSDDKAMQSTALPVAGQRMADSSDSLTSAPRGILFNPIPNVLRQKKFDGTRGGQRIDIWLEEMDKSLVINPEIFRLWKGQSTTGESIAEISLPRKLADLAQVAVNNLSLRSGSAANVRLAAEQQIVTEVKRFLDDCRSTGNAFTQGLETLARTGYVEKVMDAILTTVDGDAKIRIKELGVHRCPRGRSLDAAVLIPN